MPNNEDEKRTSSDDEPCMSRRDFIKMRLAQLNEQDIGIAKGTDEDFLKRRAVFDAEFNDKLAALDKLRQTQLQAVTRRTLGEHFCLQNSIEQEIIDLYNAHFKFMFPDPQQFYDEYVDALKKYEYLDDETRMRNLTEGRPAIDVKNLNDYNDDYFLREGKKK